MFLCVCVCRLALRLDSVGALLLLIIAVLIVNGVVGGNSFCMSFPVSVCLSSLFRCAVSTNASTAALALSQGLMLTYFFNFLTVQHSEAETKMSAVERINGKLHIYCLFVCLLELSLTLACFCVCLSVCRVPGQARGSTRYY